MTARLQIDLRRQKVKHMIAMSIPTVSIAEKLGVHRHTVERDIESIKEDILKVLHENGREDIFLQIEARRSLLEQYYWNIYQNADNWGTRLSALKQIQNLMMDWINILEKMGVIDEIASSPSDLTEEQERFRQNVIRLDREGWKIERQFEIEQYSQENAE